jgi:hypothetical protein
VVRMKLVDERISRRRGGDAPSSHVPEIKFRNPSMLLNCIPKTSYKNNAYIAMNLRNEV